MALPYTLKTFVTGLHVSVTSVCSYCICSRLAFVCSLVSAPVLAWSLGSLDSKWAKQKQKWFYLDTVSELSSINCTVAIFVMSYKQLFHTEHTHRHMTVCHSKILHAHAPKLLLHNIIKVHKLLHTFWKHAKAYIISGPQINRQNGWPLQLHQFMPSPRDFRKLKRVQSYRVRQWHNVLTKLCEIRLPGSEFEWRNLQTAERSHKALFLSVRKTACQQAAFCQSATTATVLWRTLGRCLPYWYFTHNTTGLL
jgi:hypothetical protein